MPPEAPLAPPSGPPLGFRGESSVHSQDHHTGSEGRESKGPQGAPRADLARPGWARLGEARR